MIARAAALVLVTAAAAQENFKRTDSDAGYVHHLEVYDAAGRKIDPADPQAPPYSPRQTCKSCHDVAAIEKGYHFNHDEARPGEPWLWTDARTGTVLPLSYRGRAYRPDALGLDPATFIRVFGRHLAGGAGTYTGTDTSAWTITGNLEIDCMFCHAADRSYRHEAWAKQIDAENFAWAPTAAIGLGSVTGSAKGVTDPDQLPQTRYDPRRFDGEGKVFFDVVRTPTNRSCYQCHSTRAVGTERWLHDGDVHLQAGMRCADCHKNGIEHHTVRGFEGEAHPAGETIASLSCRGCHLDETDGKGNIVSRGGRLGAPKPEHRGLPVLHLEKMSCTSCHSGPVAVAEAGLVQTGMAHGLGLASQTRSADDLPQIRQSVLRRDADGVIKPFRATWPSFWGWLENDAITPIAPAEAYKTVRRSMRIRRDLRKEVGTEYDTSIAKGLAAFAKLRDDAVPVFVTNGRAHRLNGDAVEAFEHAAAEPLFWPIGHDVRPARQSAGIAGCAECHSAGAPFVYSTVTATGVAPASPAATPALESMELDPALVESWELAFSQRDAFKWIGFASIGLCALILAFGLFVGIGSVVRRRRAKP